MKRVLMIALLMVVCLSALYVKSVYDVNASINSQRSKIGTYIVNFREVTLTDVSHFANLFNIKEEFFEDDVSFVFKNENEKLTVFKHLNQINYKLLKPKNNKTAVIKDDVVAAEIAVDFLQKKRLPFEFEKALVGFDGANYKVVLVRKLGDIDLYAFNNTIIVDIYGNVLNVDYFSPGFSKYGSCEMLEVSAACKSEGVLVPEEIFENGKISVIYIYENSIIIPGYLVEGQLNDGSVFKRIVSAACFDNY